jgi:hypothetical protein
MLKAECVDYGALDDTAKKAVDYSLDRGTLCWEDGEEGIKTFSISILDNDIQEQEYEERKFTLSLFSRDNVEIGVGVTRFVIINDDLPECFNLQAGYIGGKCNAAGQTFSGIIPENSPDGEPVITIRYDSHIVGTAENKVIFTDTVNNNGGRIDHAVFEKGVINRGKITHSTFRKGAIENTQGLIIDSTIESGAIVNGGRVSGNIINKGILIDVKLDNGQIEGGIVQGIIHNDGIIKNVHIQGGESSGAFIIGGKLAGKITGDSDFPVELSELEVLPNSHLENVFFGNDVILAEGTKLGGIIEGNDKKSVVLENVEVLADSHLKNVTIGENVTLADNIIFEDVHFSSNTHIINGKFQGNITGDVKNLVTLENVTISDNSHFKNVIISKNVILAENVTLKLENVNFKADTHITGGKLQGNITGDFENPIILEKVEVLADSHLENARIDENVILADNVTQVNVTLSDTFNCTRGLGIDVQHNSVDTKACFVGKLNTLSKTQGNDAKLSPVETQKISLSITIYPDKDIGKTADILMVARYNNWTEETWYTRDTQTWKLWDNDINHLPIAKSQLQLSSSPIEIQIYEGNLRDIPGELTVYVGYRLKNGTIIYNGEYPIHFWLSNALSVDKTQENLEINEEIDIATVFVPLINNVSNNMNFIHSDERLEIATNIHLDPSHVEKSANIYMVALYQHDNQQIEYTRNGQTWQIWDNSLDSLQSAKYIDELTEIVNIKIYNGYLKNMPGDFTVYLGYQLDGEDDIIFNGIAPVHFAITKE